MTALSHSGRSIDDVTVEAACNGELVLDDIRISLNPFVELSAASGSGVVMIGLLLGTVLGATTSGRTIPRFTHYNKRQVMVRSHERMNEPDSDRRACQ